MKLSRFTLFLLVAGSIFLGIVVGGTIFSDSQPRSFIALKKCDRCLRTKDLLGLILSAGIKNTPSFIPFVVYETDKTIAIKHPHPAAYFHFVIFPKKDIKSLSDISANDRDSIMDALAVSQKIIADNHMRHYRFYTNGAGFQDLTYLHFHLVGDDPQSDDDRARRLDETRSVR